LNRQPCEIAMSLTVSSKYQVVIPAEVRRSTGIRAGQKVEVIKYGDHMAIVPVPQPSTMRGFLKQARTHAYRDNRDRH
jgi:AbrB family looped-hinge helix DNA binding protein